MSTKKVEKQLTMRQQLRVKAESELVKLKDDAKDAVQAVADDCAVDVNELIKAISVGSHKTADHALVTQLANGYEAAIVKLWNDQQELPIGDEK